MTADRPRLDHPEHLSAKTAVFLPVYRKQPGGFLDGKPARMPPQQIDQGSPWIAQGRVLLLLVAIFPHTLLALMSGDLLALTFSAVGHDAPVSWLCGPSG